MNAMSESTSGTDSTTHGKRALPLVIVDASNVAFGNSGGVRRPTLAALNLVLEKIPGKDYEVRVLADASLRHRIDRREEYEALVRSGVILQTPAGRSADQFMAHLARKRRSEGQKVLILTNDLLRQNPDLEPLRATFLVVEEGEVIFDPPLEPVFSAPGEESTIPSRGDVAGLPDPVQELSF
jgi:hypothetical protein